MACFCEVPADVARSRLHASIPILPPPPLALRLTAAIPALLPEGRLDLQIATGFNFTQLPNIVLGGGPLAQLALTISMSMGTFSFDDIPKLEFQMEMAAASVARNVWPRLGWLTQLKLQPLLNFALIARLVIDLQAMGLDPMNMTMSPAAPMVPSTRFALTMPQLAKIQLVMGLPPLMKMTEALNVPPLGDAGAVPGMNNALMPLASLVPPSLVIPLPMLTKLAIVLESLATIEQAFGDAFSPATWQMIDSMMRLWSTFPLPLPIPALALSQKLDLLPTMEDLRLAEQIAGHSNASLGMSFSPPKLQIAQFLNVMVALSASLQVVTDMPAFDQCSMCPCS
ncbi:MAG: hypothetical protein AAF409_00890 [Pseudomonadota bacterium]